MIPDPSTTSTTSTTTSSGAFTSSLDIPSRGCSTCRFYEASPYTDWGVCHRYPHSEMVNPTYWCGEWASLHGMFTK